jgi:diguanylate cyclase (GGDEF)-like protein
MARLATDAFGLPCDAWGLWLGGNTLDQSPVRPTEDEIDDCGLGRLQSLARLAREDTLQQHHLSLADLASVGAHRVGAPSLEHYRALRFLSLRDVLGRRLSAAVEYEIGRRMADQAGVRDMSEALTFLSGRRIGRVDLVAADEDTVVVDILDCASCAGLPDIEESVCHLEAGLIGRTIEKALGRLAHCREVLCCAHGADRCRFIVSADLGSAMPPAPTDLCDAQGRIAVEIMSALTGVASEAMRLAEELRVKNAELALLATTDPLTCLANRRALIARIDEELERARRYGTPVAMAMIDLDNFKQVNDTYGHDVGDQVLRRTADTLTANVRSVDLAARYGGEEFTVLFPHLSLEQAVRAMERFRARLSGDDAKPRVTVSIGVAAAPPAEADLDVLLSLADQALYSAKLAGKDRVVGATSLEDLRDEDAA